MHTRVHLENDHDQSHNQLASAMAKAPQRPKQGCCCMAATNCKGRQRLHSTSKAFFWNTAAAIAGPKRTLTLCHKDQ